MIVDYTLVIVILGTSILGITTGALGCFALLQRQSLLADAISHASLPGIAAFFWFTHSKNPALLLSGGALAGFIGTLFIVFVFTHTKIKKDAALGIVLSVFFGLGLVFLTAIQKQSIANQAILNKFLFGNASTLLRDDIYVMMLVSIIVLAMLMLFWKEFKLLTFDHMLTEVMGYSTVYLQLLLTILLVFSIVIGLQTVGVVLMSTLFIAPAAAARQWAIRLESMVILAALFGACASILGSLISCSFQHIPTGPTIVIVLSVIVLISIFCAPNRGILWHHIIRKKYE